jgi:DNA-binding MarR family transcriptional regulator
MMIDHLGDFDKMFESRVRIGIMAILAVEDGIDYNGLKTALDVTDGNLASHLKALEKEAYIKVVKAFFGRKPNTTYTITKVGKIAFEAHLKALEKIIKSVQPVALTKKK